MQSPGDKMGGPYAVLKLNRQIFMPLKKDTGQSINSDTETEMHLLDRIQILKISLCFKTLIKIAESDGSIDNKYIEKYMAW